MNGSRVLLICVLVAAVALLSLQAPPALGVGATFVVDSTANSGDPMLDGDCQSCTLREAIQEANFLGGTDVHTINFNIPGTQLGCSGSPNPVCTITPNNALPAITSHVLINGYSQPGASANTNPITAASNAVLKIELDGTSAGTASGLSMTAGSSSVRGLVINRFTGQGIELSGAGGNTIAGNYIGTNVAGTTALANSGSGVLISSTSTNTIGGETAADRNVISGNTSHGITITGAAATDNVVWGNFIGTQADGVTALGNGQDGVHIVAASNNEIGDVASARQNTIAFNNGDGVSLSGFPFPTGNAIRANSIFSNTNTGMGIDLDPNGVNPNDAGDPDGGANNGQNWPALTLAVSGADTNVHGTLDSTASTTFNLDFYHSASCDAVGNGEGEVYLGSVLAGNGSFVANFPTAVAAGRVVTATATRAALPLDTSEFSNCVTAGPMVVDTTSDASLTACTSSPGDCSLRGAITNANAAGSPDDVINFNIPAGSAGCVGAVDPVCTITIGSALPDLLGGSDIIDGTGANVVVKGAEARSYNCINIDSNGNNIRNLQLTDCASAILVCCDHTGNVIRWNNIYDSDFGVSVVGNSNLVVANKIGTNAGGSAVHPDGGNTNGGVLLVGDSNTVGGVCGFSCPDRNIISGNATGIQFQSGADGNVIQGNYVGTDVTGTIDLGNSGNGVAISNGANNCIGGAIIASVCTVQAGAGNLISANDQNGMNIQGPSATGNRVFGNYIGTDTNGTSALGNSGYGVFINVGGGNTVGGGTGTAVGRNVISGNANGVGTLSSSGNFVRGNYIGTDATGSADLGNGGFGVNLEGGSGNTIGGASAGEGNVISGNNSNGVRISGSNSNTVQGNLVGTTAGGTAALGNVGQNVRVDNATGNMILDNVIAASGDVGVRVGGTTSGNVVKGNFIGTDASGTIPLGNASHGVDLLSVSTTVGGTGGGEGNVIAFNGGDGVRVDGAVATATGNQIRGNSIHHNAGKGIENINGGNGEPGHAPPVITAAGSASGTATCNNPPCEVDVYSDGADEGRIYHGSAPVSGGTWSFAGAVVGPNVTATLNDNNGNTSEFSGPFACPNADADLMCDSGDPCLGNADCDSDGWMDGSEANFIGTDPQDACADTTTPNDERGPGFGEPVPPWPPDFNDDGSVTGADLSAIAAVIGQGVPPAPVRRDIGQPPDGAITGADLSAVAGKIGTSCTP